MDRAFYNRADEIRRLVRFLADASGGLVVLYGRRRCGKSTLLQRVLAAEHVYLQADQRETPLQLESLATVLSRRLPDFDKVRYRTWDELLASLYARVDRFTPVCLDEFPYLAQADPALPSILQRYIDRPDSQVAWLLCGSSQRMMQGMVMDRGAPLYGRAREIIKVEPLSAGWLKRGVGASCRRSGQGIRCLGRRTALLGTGRGLRQSPRSAGGSCLEPAWGPSPRAGQVVAR